MSRTPKPRAPPTTLRALVLDLDARLHGDTALSDVTLPFGEWNPLVEAAQEEHERELDAVPDDAELVALRALREAVLRLDHARLTIPIRHTVSGAEWQEVLSRALKTMGVPREPELDQRESDEELALAAGRRLNGAGFKRAAKAAREVDSSSVCHHCGVDVLNEIRSVDLPEGAFCDGCCIRLRANPSEFERHSEPKKPAKKKGTQIDLTEAIAAKTGKGGGKFPLKTGPTEKCTFCGAEQGLHRGKKSACPPVSPETYNARPGARA